MTLVDQLSEVLHEPPARRFVAHLFVGFLLGLLVCVALLAFIGAAPPSVRAMKPPPPLTDPALRLTDFYLATLPFWLWLAWKLLRLVAACLSFLVWARRAPGRVLDVRRQRERVHAPLRAAVGPQPAPAAPLPVATPPPHSREEDTEKKATPAEDTHAHLAPARGSGPGRVFSGRRVGAAP